ncbi:MAG: hypothetical protein ACRDNF_23955, partial [Streptosporangiaceae bacterium]
RVPSVFDEDAEPEILESGSRRRTASLLGRVPRWAMLAVVAVVLVGGGVVLAVGHGRQVTPGPKSPAVRVVSIPDSCPGLGNATSSGPPGPHPMRLRALSGRRTGRLQCCVGRSFTMQPGPGHARHCDLDVPAPPAPSSRTDPGP